MAENGLERDGGVWRTHQQQNGVPDGVPANQSQQHSDFPAQKWCDSSLESVCMQMMVASMEEFVQAHRQLMAQQQQDFFQWYSSSGVLTGSDEILPAEPTSCDDLEPEEGNEKLQYEYVRLLGMQCSNGTIDLWSPVECAEQLGMDCSCTVPLDTARGKLEEEAENEGETMQKRSHVEFIEVPRRLKSTVCNVTVVTEKLLIESGSPNEDKFRRHSIRKEDEQQKPLNVVEDVSSHCQQSVRSVPADDLQFAKKFGDRDVVFGQGPELQSSRDAPSIAIYHHITTNRSVRRKLFWSHRPRLRPRTRWKFGTRIDRSVNHRHLDWIQRCPSESALLAALPVPKSQSRVRKLTS